MVQFQFQIEAAPVPYELLLSLPYVTTIAVLAWRRASTRSPAALSVPYER